MHTLSDVPNLAREKPREVAADAIESPVLDAFSTDEVITRICGGAAPSMRSPPLSPSIISCLVSLLLRHD